MAIFYPTGGGGSGMDKDDFTALREHVLKGKIAGTSDSDEPAEGTLEVQSVINFSIAQYSSLTMLAVWALPQKGPWSGLRIMCKQSGYPSTPDDGTLFYEGSATSASKALAAGTWYFRAWDYMSTNYGRVYGGYRDSAASNIQIKGQQVYTSSAYFTVPANVRQIQIFCVGGGGGCKDYQSNPSGGAGGGYTNTGTYNVTPGQQLYVSIGAGGNGSNGGTTSVGGVIFAAGGGVSLEKTGGAGGSGGGGSGLDINRVAGQGGSDGSYGEYRSVGAGGAGQGRTTRAFGESNNTLYAGGGGGGANKRDGGGNGGAGGGGKGANYYSTSTPWGERCGTPGTGGGAGGDTYYGSDGSPSTTCPTGGSGIAIIRWGY